MPLQFTLKNGKKVIPYETKAVIKGSSASNTYYINGMNEGFSAFWVGTPSSMGITDFTKPTIFTFEFINDFKIIVTFDPNYSSSGSSVSAEFLDNNNNLINSIRSTSGKNWGTAFSDECLILRVQTNEPDSDYESGKYGAYISINTTYITSQKQPIIGNISNNNPILTNGLLDTNIAPSRYQQMLAGNYTVVNNAYFWGETSAKYKEKTEAFTSLYTNTVIDDDNDLMGNSGVGGGGGSHITESDFIGIPSLPSINILNNRMVSCYSMSNVGLNELSAFLWSDSFYDAIIKNFNDPMQNIIDLSIMPVNTDIYESGLVKIGNLITDAHGDLIESQFYEIDLGTLDVNEIWGSALDYAPYTKATLYLPFIGYMPLDINKIMGSTLGVKYHLDIITGDFVAYVTSNDRVIVIRNGNLKTSIALSSSNNIERYKALVGLVGTVASSGANPISMGESGLNSALTVAMGKPNYESVGNFSSTSGLMSPMYAYIIYSRPNQCLPKKYKTFNGYPSYITSKLSTLSGFTSVNEIHLEGINATSEELTEIESLLKGGVYL